MHLENIGDCVARQVLSIETTLDPLLSWLDNTFKTKNICIVPVDIQSVQSLNLKIWVVYTKYSAAREKACSPAYKLFSMHFRKTLWRWHLYCEYKSLRRVVRRKIRWYYVQCTRKASFFKSDLLRMLNTSLCWWRRADTAICIYGLSDDSAVPRFQCSE